jgi:hypothetical protein
LIGSVQSDETQVFNGCSDALPARPGQAVLAFDHDGDFHKIFLPLSRADIAVNRRRNAVVQ